MFPTLRTVLNHSNDFSLCIHIFYVLVTQLSKVKKNTIILVMLTSPILPIYQTFTLQRLEVIFNYKFFNYENGWLTSR